MVTASGERASAIYTGTVRHRRIGARPRAFSYRTTWLYLDLDELPTVFQGRWLWSFERPNVNCVLRRDLLGGDRAPAGLSAADAARDLDTHVRGRVRAALGFEPKGPIRVLVAPRSFGLAFNPVAFYWCFDRLGVAVDAVVAEITNTPWGERHAYVLDGRAAGAHQKVQRFHFEKAFHVSPFQPMEHHYDWSFARPADTLAIHMENVDPANGAVCFDATLSLTRRPLDGRSLAAMLARHPAQGLLTLAAIYGQAARLWLGRTPFFSHPSGAPRSPTER
mgnify:CR=1 FL=1